MWNFEKTVSLGITNNAVRFKLFCCWIYKSNTRAVDIQPRYYRYSNTNPIANPCSHTHTFTNLHTKHLTDYQEISQTTEGTETVVTLQVTATYNFGDAITYDYQNFVLNIRTPRGGLEPYPMYLLTGTAKPFQTGSVTIGSSNTHATFTLTFRFSTIQSSFGGDIHFAFYELVYNSNTISPSTPQPTISPSPIPTAQPTTTPSQTPTSTPNQTEAGSTVFGFDFDWLEVAVFVIVGVVVALLVVVVVLQGKRIRVLEMKQNDA